jgi:hypothetical protein
MRNLALIVMGMVLLICIIGKVSAAVPQAPGFHGKVKCIDDPSQTFELFIPKSYEKFPDRRFPILLLSSPTAKPGSKRFLNWAEEHDFIIIGLLNSRNGPFEPNKRNQDAVDNTIEKSGLRIHPHLRHALGGSGGAVSGFYWAHRKPYQFAGVHMAIQSAGDRLPPHIVLTFFARTEDPNIPISKIDLDVQLHISNGNLVQYVKEPGGHKGAGTQKYQSYIEFMYWNTILNHPQHTRRDAQEGLDVLARKLDKLTQITDLNQRLEQLAVFIEIESIRKSPIGKDFFVKWEEAAFALYDQAADNAGRMWAIIAMAEKPWFEQIDSKRRRELIKNLKTYARAPVKGEYKAWEAFTKVHAAAKAAKNTRAKQKVGAGYRSIAKRMPDTRYGKKAAEEAPKFP